MVLLDMNYNTLNTKVRADSILLLETKHWENTAGQASPSLCYVFEAGSLAACNAHRGANQSTPRGLLLGIDDFYGRRAQTPPSWRQCISRDTDSANGMTEVNLTRYQNWIAIDRQRESGRAFC
jgi:hypothetical protein